MSKTGLSERERAEHEKAKYHQSVLEYIKDQTKDLLKLAKETLNDLNEQIISEIKGKNKKISKGTKKKVDDITDILNTAGHRASNKELINKREELRDALEPLWPYDFPQEITINLAFKEYRRALEDAIGSDRQEWNFIIQESAKSTFYSRIEDKLNAFTELLSEVKKMKEIEIKKSED